MYIVYSFIAMYNEKVLVKPYIVYTVNIKRSERELWKKNIIGRFFHFPSLFESLVDYSHSTNLNWKQKKEGVQVETQNWMHDLANCFIQLLLTCCCRQNPIAVCLCNYRSLGYPLFIIFFFDFLHHTHDLKLLGPVFIIINTVSTNFNNTRPLLILNN